MSGMALLYLVSMGVLFVGQRLLDGSDGPQLAVTVAGAILLAVAAALRVRALRGAKDPGLRLGHRLALVCLLVGVGSLVLCAATTDGVVESLTLGDEAEERWLGVWRSLWPLVWLLGTGPMLAIDWACKSSPVLMPKRRVKELGMHGLVAAMGIGLVFPVNYIASQKKERWDLAYFKTPQPGTATLALVQALETPVDVRIFMPPSSEVAQELRNYFAPLEGPLFSVQVIDEAAEPRLADALGVRGNGHIAFTQGEVVLDPPTPIEGESEDAPPKPVTRTIKVNDDFEQAKRALKTIDAEVQKTLLDLGQGERVAYLTTSHGELTTKRLPQPFPMKQALALRSVLKSQGFEVKEFNLSQPLADGVPDDASVVFVLGPLYPFTRPEVEALRSYVQSGGSLFLSLEPKVSRAPMPVAVDDPLEAMAEELLGVRMGEGVLADEVAHARNSGEKADNFLLLTASFTSHGSSLTLAAERQRFAAPFAGWLDLIVDHEAGHTVTVRSNGTAFADIERDAVFSADAGEEKGAKPLVVAVSGSSNGVGWRAIVTSTANMVSDVVLSQEDENAINVLPGNVQFVRDATNWLIGAESLSGTTETEEDVRIEHSKEGQTWWFYSTVLGIPLLVFGLGAARVWMRQRGGAR